LGAPLHSWELTLQGRFRRPIHRQSEAETSSGGTAAITTAASLSAVERCLCGDDAPASGASRLRVAHCPRYARAFIRGSDLPRNAPNTIQLARCYLRILAQGKATGNRRGPCIPRLQQGAFWPVVCNVRRTRAHTVRPVTFATLFACLSVGGSRTSCPSTERRRCRASSADALGCGRWDRGLGIVVLGSWCWDRVEVDTWRRSNAPKQ